MQGLQLGFLQGDFALIIFLNQYPDFIGHFLKVVGQFTDFILTAIVDQNIEITFLHRMHGVAQAVNALDRIFGKQVAQKKISSRQTTIITIITTIICSADWTMR